MQSNQTNSFQDIGFGYVGPATQHKPPAVIAYEQTSDAGQTNGDLVFGTRSTTVGSTAATAVMRIRASGAVEVDGDATMSETLNVNKDTTLDADLIVTKAATAWTHSGGTSLTVTSTNGYIKLVSTSQYVDVESVRFTDDYIGVAGDTDIIRLTSTGSVATVLLDGKLDVTDDVRIGDTSDPKLTVDASNGNTVINGTLDVNGDTVFEGQVLVKGFFHALGDYRIGDSAPSDSLTIKAATNQTGDMTMMDTLDVYGVTTLYNNLVIVGSKDLTMNTDKFKVTGSSGNVETLGSVTMHAVSSVLTHDGASGSLAISSSTGPVTIEGQTTGGYVDVESIRFTDNQIGSTGDPDLITIVDDAVTIAGGLTTTTMAVTSTFGVTSDFAVNSDKFIVHSSNGNVTMKGDLEMEGDTATLTHSGSTGGLAISSAQHVDVESVRFTGDQIGSTGDPDLITLTADNVKVAGTLEMSVNSAALTHSGTTGLAISSTNGYVTIAGGTGDYVDVEGVKFNDDTIKPTSSSDHLTITGGTGATDYVDIESVRFTNAQIGLSGDTDLIALAANDLTVNGAVTVTTTMDVTGNFAVNGDKFKVAASDGDTEILGSLTMKAASGVITHDGASGSLAISSSTGPVTLTGNTYVDVESVRFTNAKIGLSGDDDIMTLTSTSAGVNNVAFADKITTGDLATLNSATVTTTLHSGGDFTVGSGPKLTVTASSGDVVTDGKVAIAGAHGDATKALYVTGSVYATGAVTSASDARFKRDVRAIEDPLAIARALEPVTFEFRRDEFPARDFPAETQAGFLAQDLESVLPHLVSEDDGGYKGVAYERVGVYALAGVKALDDKFERRNGTVAELEARVAYLERALAALISKASGPEVAGR